MNIQDVELQDRFLSSTERNMKCLNKKDMKAWQLNRRHCIWNRTGIRHVYIECSALCAIEFLRSKDPPSGHWAHAHTVVVSSHKMSRRHLQLYPSGKKKGGIWKGGKGGITRRQTCAGPGKRSCYASPEIFFPESDVHNSEGPNGTYSLTSLQAQLKLTPTIC